MNTSLSLPSIRLLTPAVLTTPPHFMPEYINNLSLLLSLFFIFALHRTQSLNIFPDFSLSLSLFISHLPRHIGCCFCFPHSGLFFCECAVFNSKEIPRPCSFSPSPLVSLSFPIPLAMTSFFFFLSVTYEENSWTHPLPLRLFRMDYSQSGRFLSQG